MKIQTLSTFTTVVLLSMTGHSQNLLHSQDKIQNSLLKSFAATQDIVSAFHSVPLCTGAVTASVKYVARQTGPSEIALTEIQTGAQLNITTTIGIRDIKATDSSLFILGDSQIQEWSLETGKLVSSVKTRNLDRPMEYRERAFGMTWHKDQLIIAHGRSGYSIYATKIRKIIAQDFLNRAQWPHESTITDVVVKDDIAFFSAMEFTLSMPNQPKSLNGVIALDLSSMKEIKVTSGLDPGAETIDIIGDELLIGFGGPIQFFSIKDIMTKKQVEIKRILWNFSPRGRPYGQYHVSNNQILTCFWKSQTQTQQSELIPLVLSPTQTIN